MVVTNQPFDDASVGDSEDDDLIPIQSSEDWVAQLDDDLSGLSVWGGVQDCRSTEGRSHVHHFAGMDPVGRFSPLGGGKVNVPEITVFVASP